MTSINWEASTMKTNEKLFGSLALYFQGWKKLQQQILYSRYYAEAWKEWWGTSTRLSTQATYVTNFSPSLATFLRSCVAQALNREMALLLVKHFAIIPGIIKDLIFLICSPPLIR